MEASSEFDNNVTATYKQAAGLGLPVEYTYRTEDGVLHSIFDFIGEKINQEVRLIDIYSELVDLTTSLGPLDIAMVYAQQYNQMGIAMKDIYPLINEFIEENNAEAGEEAEETGTQKISLATFRDLNSFNSEYTIWAENYQRLLTVTQNTLGKILDIQYELSQETEVPILNLTISRLMMQYKPTWKEGKSAVEAVDGIEIFNYAVPSFEVPYIQYNGPTGQRYIRLYKGSEEDKDVPDTTMVIYNQTQASKNDTIYITLWTGDKGTIPTRESYVRVVYSLTSNTIEIPCPTEKVDEMYRRIAASLSRMNLGQGKEVKVWGGFDISGVTINETILHYKILVDFLFYTYLYIDESGRSIIDKQRINIHYKTFTGTQVAEQPVGTGYIRNAASVSITFGRIEAEDTEDLLSPLPGFKPPESKEDKEAKLVHVNVIRAESRDVLNQFLKVFSRLLSRYMKDKPKVEDYLDSIVPGSFVSATGEDDEDDEDDEDVKPKGKGKGTAGRRGRSGDTKIKKLKSVAPDVFIKRYARKCQCPYQPIIIEPDEVEEWQNKTFIDASGNTRNRQVMPFPPPKTESEVPKWWIVCPNDKNPFPALKENKELGNDTAYPYVPCCAKSESIEKPNSNYNKYHETKADPKILKKPKETTKANYRMTTGKIMAPGRTAAISKPLTELLRSASTGEVNEGEDFIRCGVPATTSSLIHCMYLAQQNSDYLSMKTMDEKEEFCQETRKEIARWASPLVYKQELYDMPDQEITQRVEDPEVFLDPYLYYRGIEEYFEMNVFVFNPNGPLHPIVGVHDAKTTNPVVEIPRCKLTHIRVHRTDRPSAIILKHWGSENTAMKHPQCELIISRGQVIAGKPKKPTFEDAAGDTSGVITTTSTSGGYGSAPGVSTRGSWSFGQDFTEVLYGIYEASLRTYVWSFPYRVITDSDPQPGEEIQCRDNPFAQVNWEELLKENFSIVGQQVDNYGKLRCIVIEVPEEGTVTLCVPPSQPLNVPRVHQMTLADEKLVRKLLGEPAGVIRNGLWYTAIDMQWAVFVPTKVTSSLTPDTPPAPVHIRDVSIVGDYRDPIRAIRTDRRYAMTLLQLINWCWRNDRGQHSLEDWWNIWVVKDDGKQMKTPDGRAVAPKLIARRLPSADSTSSALKAISGWWAPYFMPDSIHLYSALYDKTLSAFKRREVETDGLPMDDPFVAPSTHIDGLYERDEDFIVVPKSVVFTLYAHFQNWLLYQNKQVSSLINPIYKIVDDSKALTTTEPYIYKDLETNKIYLIQNVKGGEIGRVISVCLTWFYDGINTGLLTLPSEYTLDQTPHVIYGISKSQTLLAIADESKGTNTFIQILRYAPNRYAAMLPIL